MGILQRSGEDNHHYESEVGGGRTYDRRYSSSRGSETRYVNGENQRLKESSSPSGLSSIRVKEHVALSTGTASDGGYEQFLKSVLPTETSPTTWTNVSSPRDGQEPIAIVGMGCQLPGGISNPDDLWEFLLAAKSAHGKVPSSRYNHEAFHHDDLERPGVMNTDSGYYVEDDVTAFENSFFNINNLEATYMDPQQRKLLEVVYESFESAGATLSDLSGANVGCFVGNFVTDYQHFQRMDPESLHRYTATGTGATILANRISNVFNLKGPSFVIDTACSSSLYCLHAACVALENQDCDAAVVAASNLLLSPVTQMATAKAGVLAADGKCKTFDSSADGYGRADGTGALYLKRLSDAIRDGDPIRSIIRGTAVNSNGRTAGISLPSMEGQESVIRRAYMRAGLPTDATGYVECHGTGTAVGDPIEAEALSRAFGIRQDEPLLIGSVKTNLGHSEAASGITSIIKTTLALERGVIPPTVGLKELNPKLKLNEWNMKIVTDVQPWIDAGGSSQVRRASVNSFGYGGANAHAILESFSAPNLSLDQTSSKLQSQKAFVLPFSAAQMASLKARVDDLASAINNVLREATMADVAHTLAHHRSKLPLQGFLLATQASAQKDLAFENLRMVTAPNERHDLPIAFIFTGQGAQWPQMGRELMEKFPVFRRSIQDLDYALSQIPQPPEWNIRETILSDSESSQIGTVSRSQPVCSAVQIALVDLLASWGVHPATVVGHSSGEIAAAYAAGHITAREAIETAYYRGYVVSNLAVRGAMIAVGAGEGTASQLIESLELSGKIKVACINSPESVTVSGEEPAIDTLIVHLQKANLFVRKLRTDGRAYHSHQMALVGEDYENLLRSVFTSNLSQVVQGAQMYSSLTGKPVGSAQTRNHYYWRANLESPVLFRQAVEALHSQEGNCQFVELGPHSALEQPLKQIMEKVSGQETQMSYSSALVRNKSSEQTVLSLIGMLYLRGYTEVLHRYNNEALDTSLAKKTAYPRVIPNLPKYRWAYDDESPWHEPTISSELRQRQYPRHDLLGAEVAGKSTTSFLWKNILRTKDVPWLEGHKLGDTIVFPGACYVMMAVEALHRASHTPSYQPVSLRDVRILKALPLQSSETRVEIFTEIWPKVLSKTATSNSWWEFKITTVDDSKTTTEHAVGLMSLNQEIFQKDVSIDESRFVSQAARTWYKKFKSSGLNFDGAFRSITEVHSDGRGELTQTIAKTKLVNTVEGSTLPQSKYLMHPITMDAGLQAGVIAPTGGVVAKLKALVPTTIGSLRIFPSHESSYEQPVTIRALSEPTGVASVNIEGEIRDWEGRLLIQLENVRAVEYQGFLDQVFEERHPMLRICWKPDISKLIKQSRPDALDQYLSSIHDAKSLEQQLPYLLDLMVHRDPGMRMLYLGSEENLMVQIGKCLNLESQFPRCRALVRGSILDNGKLGGSDIYPPPMTIVGPKQFTEDKDKFGTAFLVSPESDERSVPLVVAALASNAYLLTMTNSTMISKLEEQGIKFTLKTSLSDGKCLGFGRKVLATAPNASSSKGSDAAARGAIVSSIRELILLTDTPEGNIEKLVIDKVSHNFKRPVRIVSSSSVSPATIPGQSTVISLLELHRQLLTELSSEVMSSLKTVVENASILLWVTSGGFLSGEKPDFALWQGSSRTIMVENPTLRSISYDIDNLEENPEQTVSNFLDILDSETNGTNKDLEYVQRNGLVHISRFMPDTPLNDAFTKKKMSGLLESKLRDVGFCQLGIKDPGQLESLHFNQLDTYSGTMQSDHVEIEVKAVGINAKDFYTLGAKVDAKNATNSLECTGVITRVGSDVTQFAVGDRVVSMAAVKFGTMQRVPEWSCCKLLDSETFPVYATVGLVYSTAIYALEHRANVQEGESVLIHSAAGGLGIAAIQIAKLLGAEIFVTASSEAKQKYLSQTFDIPMDHIFSSRKSSFLADLLRATGGRGIDVVLNSLTGDLFHETWRACAEFGRFIEVGKTEFVDRGQLEMETFLKSVTFSAFDLSDLYNSKNPRHNRVWQKLLTETMTRLREGKIRPVQPLKVFDVSEISQAFRHFSSRNRLGKIAISLEDPESIIQVLPKRFEAKLDSEKSYLLVGCLGGLGRSLAKYLFQQGARRFVFLGLTGTDKEPARRLVNDLEAAGANVKVVKGDVCAADVVDRFVAAADRPIGGVIQAAMGLHESLFTEMSAPAWQKSVDPKRIGTWNLHNSLQKADAESALDFFIMTSSINGSIGTATEANYCAANYFLDIFARHRRTKNLAATAIAFGIISGIGYLHENPEIEAMLMRKGVRPLDEEDVLQIFDAAVAESSRTQQEIRDNGQASSVEDRWAPGAGDPLSRAHILTGLESSGLQGQREMGFDGYHNILGEPRASILVEKFNNDSGGSGFGASEGLPAQISAALSTNNTLAIVDACYEVIGKKFAQILLMPMEKLNPKASLSDFGMDSMLAAEFRKFIFQTCTVDIPFLTILDAATSMHSLAQAIATELQGRAD